VSNEPKFAQATYKYFPMTIGLQMLQWKTPTV